MTLTVDSILSQHKPSVLKGLTKGLNKIGIARNKRKKLHNGAIQKIWRFKIRENVEVEKKRLDVERKLGNR